MSSRFFARSLAVLAALAALSGCGGHGRSSSGAGGDNVVAIAVTEDGFVPQEVHVAAGQPVTLAVTRKTDKTCATELVLKEYDINQKLPLNETVQIHFTPKQAGRLGYACGMDMYKGTIVVD